MSLAPAPELEPSEPPEPTDEELLRDRRVRTVDAERVQCNECGKWLFKPNWEGHINFRCNPVRSARPRARRGN